ncbi:hypothetical protein AcV5_005323 [Taiwanofungus camphoratus]|nr:hypothetical protein AcV5_005323 [Antrodia cinnamomea]
MSSGAMQSKVGNPQVYNDGDQRPRGDEATAPFEAGQKNAHNLFDLDDNRTLTNRLEQEKKMERESVERDNANAVTDPLEPAQKHGHQPSRGAQVDAELQREDEEAMKNKGSFGPKKGL